MMDIYARSDRLSRGHPSAIPWLRAARRALLPMLFRTMVSTGLVIGSLPMPSLLPPIAQASAVSPSDMRTPDGSADGLQSIELPNHHYGQPTDYAAAPTAAGGGPPPNQNSPNRSALEETGASFATQASFSAIAAWGGPGLKMPWDQSIKPRLTSGPHNGSSLDYSCKSVPLVGASGLDFGLNYQEVLAAAAGTVTWDDAGGTIGKYVAVDHGGGWTTKYWHLSGIDSSLTSGASIPQGRVLGISGTSGSGPHLHLELRGPNNTPASWHGVVIDDYTVRAFLLDSDQSSSWNYQGTLTKGLESSSAASYCNQSSTTWTGASGTITAGDAQAITSSNIRRTGTVTPSVPQNKLVNNPFFPGWWVIVQNCGPGTGAVKLDGTEIIHTASNPSSRATRWVSSGFHTLSWSDPSLAVFYSWFPVTPACASDTPGPPPSPPPDQPQPSPSATPPPPGSCVNRAASITDVNYSDGTSVPPNSAINKTWRARNTGTCTWTNYRLAFASGDKMQGPSSVSVASTPPGQTVDITVPLQTPGTGRPRGYWQLKDNQGVNVPGGYMWIDVVVSANAPPSGGTGDNGGTPTSRITLFEISPGSSTDARSVHAVCRAQQFADFRSMRFRLGDQIPEMPNFRQPSGLDEISADIDVSSLPRGTYSAACEVSSKSAPDWANAERSTISYTLTGTPTPRPTAPSRPSLKSPYDWNMKDNSGAAASFQLCVNGSTASAGSTVQYFYQVMNQIGDPVLDSGWVTDTCWNTPSLGPSGANSGVYQWKVKAGVSNGAAASDWSQETWHFSVASGQVTIRDIVFKTYDADQIHMCVDATYGGIIRPEGQAWLNRATDGSESWRLLDGFGPDAEDCVRDAGDPAEVITYGFRIYPREYPQGCHALKITLTKKDAANQPTSNSASATSSWCVDYLRPSNFQLVAPSTHDRNGTAWNSTTINFEWTRPLRDELGYDLRVSTSNDVWSDGSPLLSVALPANTLTYTHTFAQDYARLNWVVRAKNSAGTTDTGSSVWFVIDRVASSCAVAALSATQVESVFQVNWSGTDNSSGVRSFAVQVKEARGEWTDWQREVPSTKGFDLFTGEPGHSYSFRCRATDAAGNVGPYPESADTTTRIDPSARPPTPWWNTSYGHKRNLPILNNMPSVQMDAGYPVLLQFTGSTSPTAAEMYAASLSAAKCDDLRIVANDTTEKDRLVESCTTSLIAIRFRTHATLSGGTTATTTHQLYYGNASASSPPSDPRNVFPPLADGNTIGLWYLSEGTGSTSTDASGQSNNITGIGSMSWCDGKFGKALCTGSVDIGPDGAFVPGSGSLTAAAFTFEAFVKRGSQFYGTLAAQGQSNNARERWSLGESNGRLDFTVWPFAGAGASGVSTDSNFLPDMEWHHIAVTFDGGSAVKFYRDGALQFTRALSQSGVNNQNYDLYIGSGFKAFGGRNFLGAMDSVRFSNIVRTSFPHAAFAAITTEPTVTAGSAVDPPDTTTPDLAILNVSTFPNPDGGVLITAEVTNLGAKSTQSGFYIDLCTAQPSAGTPCADGQRASFWVASPIEPGVTITLTTALTQPPAPAQGFRRSVLPANTETTTTLYLQVDPTSAVSEPNKSNNISSTLQACFITADAYEPDGSGAAARLVTVNGIAETHNFHIPGDQDWIKFAAVAGATYTINTANLGANADTTLTLYATDSTTILAQNDDFGATLASQIVWLATVNGTYYLKVSGWSSNVGGCGTAYDLSVSSLSVLTLNPSTVAIGGTVNATASSFNAGHVIELRLDTIGGLLLTTATVGSGGTLSASFTVPVGVNPGVHTVLAVSSGNVVSSATLTVTSSIKLIPQTATVLVNQTVGLEIKVDTGTQQVDGIQAALTFDPAGLQVVDADSATNGVQLILGDCGLPNLLANQADNAAGTVFLSVGVDSTNPQPISGPCTLGVVKFRGIASRLSGTAVAFAVSPASPSTRAVLGGVQVPLTPTNASLTVVATQLSFSKAPVRGGHTFELGIQPVVELRDELGNLLTSDSSTEITLRIKPQTGPAAADFTCAQGNARTLLEGVATFSGCTIDLPGAGYRLQATATGVTTGESGAFNVIWSGDADGDCVVDITDFSQLLLSFGKHAGDPAFDPRRDFNGDNEVDIIDFSILVAMFDSKCATITVVPGSGPAGTVVTVTGSNFDRSSPVSLTLDRATAATTPPQVTTAGDGAFSLTVATPSGTGAHIFKASTRGGKVIAGGVFTVQ